MARRTKSERQLNGTIQPTVGVQIPTHSTQSALMSSGSTIGDSDLHVEVNMDQSNDRATNGDSLQVLGRGVKELVQAVQTLRHLGVENLDIPLPKIVVVGDQSTGKSSLIEGMSEIKVPRASGTCTRCPLEINLTEDNGPWSCKVLIHKKYMYTGQLGTLKHSGKGLAKVEGATKSRPLGPWAPQDSEYFYFATIGTAAEVEQVLYLAQLAVLNPRDPFEKYAYIPGKAKPQDFYQVKFSPNVIQLDISGCDLPNLSFYDLPGVINVSDVPEEAYLVDLVKNLVKDYVSDKDCINLLAIPMTDDPANSSASRLILDLKADTRTMGCLTKPDRRQQGESLEQWIQILDGKRFRFRHGYHVIKNNADPLVDHATARQEEEAFFENGEPWTTTLYRFRERFGTLKLQAKLSQLLTAQIAESLPTIVEQVDRKREVIEAGLRALPEPLSGNLPAIVMREILKFQQELEKHIDGGSHLFPFPKQWNQLALQFRQMLADSKPILMLPTPNTPQTPRQTPNGRFSATPTPVSRLHATPNDVINVSDDEETSPTEHRSGAKRPHYSNDSPNKFQRPANGRRLRAKIASKQFNLMEVREIIQSAYIGGIPGQIDPRATERMIKLSMEHWEAPVEEFMNNTKSMLEDMVRDRVEHVFGHRQHTKYFDEILEACGIFLDEVMARQREVAKQLLCYEMAKPKTLNDRAMTMARDEAFALLQDARRAVRANRIVEEQEKKTGKLTEGQARADKVAKTSESSQMPPEMFGPELKAMSETKGYYECAYSRLVDMICSSAHVELFTKCKDSLHEAVMKKIGVEEEDATERLAGLLAVNPKDEERRRQLKKDMEKIVKAQEQLEALKEQHDLLA